MAIDGTEVRVAGAGHVYVAPAATALPTDVDTALAAAYVDLGYVTEDGVGFSFGRDTTDLNAWQGSKIRVLTTAEPVSVNFALMQTNSDILPVVFGGGTVTGTDPYTFTPPAKGTNTERVCVIEFTDGDISYRYCLPRVQLEGNVDFTLAGTDAVTYPLTFGVLDDDPKYLIISDDPAMAPGS